MRLSRLFFFFRRFCLFFQFGNQLPCPFYSSRVSFTQFWRSNGFPFFSRRKHSTFARTNIAFSFGLFFPSRFIMFRFHIRSPLVQAQIPNIYRSLARMLVPKLVCEVSDASGFAWFASVCCGLGRKQHDEQAELSVERDLGQSSEVVLC